MDAPTAADVANIVIYVVPGFFARLGYLARFPRRPQDATHVFIVSVALSVPLLAIASWLADRFCLRSDPTNAGFALLVAGTGLLAGYLVAVLRGLSWTRAALAALKIRTEPEATIYEQTLLELPRDESVTISLKDGRVIAGCPRLGPGYEEPGTPRELYLVDNSWIDENGAEAEGSEGLIVNVDEIVMISMAQDPVP